MAKIRHIAIKVEDQEKTAEFYKQTFGMTEAWRGPVREDGCWVVVEEWLPAAMLSPG